MAELSVKDKAIRLAKRFAHAIEAIGLAMENKLEDARNNNIGVRIRTRSGNVLMSQSKIEQLITSSFLYKLKKASEMTPEVRSKSRTQFSIAKRYAVAWKARIKRKIAKRSKGPKNKSRKKKSSATVRSSRRKRNTNLNRTP